MQVSLAARDTVLSIAHTMAVTVPRLAYWTVVRKKKRVTYVHMKRMLLSSVTLVRFQDIHLLYNIFLFCFDPTINWETFNIGILYMISNIGVAFDENMYKKTDLMNRYKITAGVISEKGLMFLFNWITLAIIVA